MRRTEIGGWRNVALLLGGSALLYLIVVACSGGGSTPRDANAQSSPATATAPCTTVIGSGAYAVASFPGKTVDQLAAAYALAEYTNATNGYTHFIGAGLQVKEGGLGYACGPAGGTDIASVKFFVP